MTKAAALVLVLGVTSALLGVSGVSPGELALFAFFELAFVLGPGLVAHSLLAAERCDVLERVALGAGLGHALLLAGFIVTAAAGARWALWLLPVSALGVALWTRPWRGHAAVALPARPAWALAGVAVAAVGLMFFAFVTQSPLPGATATVSYYPDLMWGTGLAAEALHHWPMTTPHVLGEPLRYHTFAFVDIAATSQQTGIDLPVTLLRLAPASLLLVVVLQLAHAGRRFAGDPWAAPVAAGLVLLVGGLDLGAERAVPLIGLFFSSLYLSPSQLLGLVMFLPAVVVIADCLEAGPGRPRPGTLALVALLLFGCAGAKASILPLLIGGLVVYGVWTRRIDARVVACLALSAVAFVASYLLLLSGGRSGTALNPLDSAFRSFPGRELEPFRQAGGLREVLSYPVATWVTAVALMVPLAGLAFARLSLRRPSPHQAWLLGLLACSVVAFFALDLPGFSQLYFLWYGLTAGGLLAAGGLVEAARRWRAGERRGVRAALAAGVALGVLLAVGAPAGHTSLLRAYIAVAALLGAAALGFAALSARRPAPLWPAVLVVGALLTAGLIDGPADRLPGIASRALTGETVHRQADPRTERGVTRELVRGLDWVRGHTDEDAVLAVNNHLRRPAQGDSLYFYYSALAERRVFIESWEYTDKSLAVGTAAARAGRHPFAQRLALNDAVYAGTGGSAATQLRRRGVGYVLVDRINAPVPRNRIPGKIVFRNSALIVYRL